MKYFLDTEFIEGFHKPLFGKKRHFIDLISIGVVDEDGRGLYLLSKEYNYNDADDWVKENVILPLYKEHVHGDYRNHFSIDDFHKTFGLTNGEIKRRVLDFFGCYEDCNGLFYRAPENIEVYAYYADYDWVVFCSLFGRMIDLPKGFPMYCKDLKQTYDEKNLWWTTEVNRSKNVPNLKDTSDYPKQDKEHNALDDAKWNKKLYEFLQSI